MAADPSIGGQSVPASLIEVAASMRAHAPHHLDALRRALREAADAAAHAVVAAPPDTVQVAQGRARVFQALATLFANPEPFMIQIAGRNL